VPRAAVAHARRATPRPTFSAPSAPNAHLAEISHTVVEGAHAGFVLDGVGWHGSKALRCPDNITLLPLPPYAPEINPIEEVWA